MEKIEGKNIKLELVTNEDIDFILNIRHNHKHKKNLGKTVLTHEEQRKWLNEYKKREKEKKDFYYVISLKNENREKVGLIRVYDIVDNTFEQGSLVIKEGQPINVILETLKLIYTFAFEDMKFIEGRLRVKKINKVGNKFHKNYGAILYKEDEEMNYYKVYSECIVKINNILEMIGE